MIRPSRLVRRPASFRVRRLPLGSEVRPDGTHFRIWAPRRRAVDILLEDGTAHPLVPDGEDGCFAGLLTGAGPGTLYRCRLDGGGAFPDPASRFQPEGPHGPSEVIDPDAFPWTDADWPGLAPRGQVVSEIHVGTFTPEGTWAAAADKLPLLKDVGITCLEVMPVAEFPGRFGWGYDGVNLFAPTRLYGRPDDFRRFVDRAHAEGLGVILDVVCNHLGPDGNYLPEFSETLFSRTYRTEWGESLNFDAEGSEGIRAFYRAMIRLWIAEYHLDGFRFDATQDVKDRSEVHILSELARAAREAAGGRSIYLVAENEPQHTSLVRDRGFDALWNDDFHHSALAALRGRREAYYTDYRGTPQELLSALKWGYLFQGQHYVWQKKARGTPGLDLPAHAYVHFLENHDQVANSAHGRRPAHLGHPGVVRALTAVVLLGPQTPLLFQGQEFGSSAPFLYFADHRPELTPLVAAGRRDFLRQFPSMADARVELDAPGDPATFRRCVLDWSERDRHTEALALHRDLLRLRREDPVFRAQDGSRVDGAVLSPHAFLVRFFGEGGDDRLLLVNLGPDLELGPAPEPLYAPPSGVRWALRWSSEWPAYGGGGMPDPPSGGVWTLPAGCAVVLGAER